MLKPSLLTLVDIYIVFNIDDDGETYNGILGGLCHELEKMGGQNLVKTIKLLIWVYAGNHGCTRWGELDDVLGSPEGWPALKEVSLLLYVMGASRNNLDKTLRELPMTKLAESKRVHFQMNVYPIG
jgi:hypothetical protein